MACFSEWDPGGCGCGGTAWTQDFEVHGCDGTGYPGVTVSVYSASGGTLLASGTTDASGDVSLAWTGTGSTWWVTVGGASARFQAFAQSMGLINGNFTPLDLAEATGYHCSQLCLLPLADALHLTDSIVGAVALNYDAGTGNWVGTATYNYPGCGAAGCGCVANAAVPITYTFDSTTGLVSASFPLASGVSSCPWDTPLGGAGGFDTVSAPSYSCPPAFAASGTFGDGAFTNFAQCLYCGATATWTLTE